MKFQMLLKSKMLKLETFLAFRRSDVVFIMPIKIKLQAVFGILTILSMTKLMLSSVERGKSFITLDPVLSREKNSEKIK